jgi:carbonic anhydrase
MEALLTGLPNEHSLPHLREWLALAASVRHVLQTEYVHLKSHDDRATAAAQENVLFALENLHTYPVVQTSLANGSLRLHGWFFKIATAELFAYDPDAHQFSPLVTEATGKA